jgi:hypothetical protein
MEIGDMASRSMDEMGFRHLPNLTSDVSSFQGQNWDDN